VQNHLRILCFSCITILSLLVLACGSSNSDKSKAPLTDTRSFQMGFTPWLYEASFTAQNLVYDQIQNNGDIVSHHLMSGIPWQEAFDQTPYPQAVEDEINTRLSKTRTDKTVYLSIDSLNGLRTELAPNWGSGANEPRSGVWTSRNFSSAEVITAYGNFALDMIARFKPDYFNYSVEVSGLIFNSPSNFDAFVVFSEAIYNRIKSVHPDLPMLVSLSLKTPGNTEMVIAQAGFSRIANFVDIVGASVYPYAFYDHADKGDPEKMPADWLSQIAILAPNKPMAITEVAWAAEDLVLPSFGIDLPITANNQSQFLDILFNEASLNSAQFIIWFCIDDYDTLWETVLAEGEVARIWRDTGLYDENLNPRPALDKWQTWYQRTFVFP
jgi:hypothetical protein